jgi:hypothetical protein
MVRAIMLQESKWPIINGQTKYTQVVSVEHSMAESIALPKGDSECRSLDDFIKHRLNFIILASSQVREEVVKGVLEHIRKHVVLLPVTRACSACVVVFRPKDLESSESDEGRSHS